MRPLVGLSVPDFFVLWRDAAFSNHEQVHYVDLSSTFVVGAGSAVAALVKTLTLGNALQLLLAADPNPDNIVLTGEFLIPKNNESYKCLCRVEVGSGAFRGKARVAVRSNSPKLSVGVAQVLAWSIGDSGGTANEAS